MEPEIELPVDLQVKWREILIEDMDARIRDLTTLVVLQESELAFMGFCVFGIIIYLVTREYHNGR